MEQATRERHTGFVLSGGAARGFAQIGMLRVLEQADIRPDVLAGTSIGAIIAAFLAHGYSAEDIYALGHKTSWRDVLDLSFHAGLIKGERLHAFLAEYLPADFSELKKPLAITTTDIETGEEVIILEGDLITALRASCCFPGAFEPVYVAGRLLADGGIVNNLPVNAVAFLNANYTVALDVTPSRRAEVFRGKDQRFWERFMATVRLERRNSIVHMLLRATDIMQSMLTDIQYNLHPADLRIHAPMPQIRIESFWAFEEIVKLGEEAALKSLAAGGLVDRDRAEARLEQLESEHALEPGRAKNRS